MPRYLAERTLGDISYDALEQVADASTLLREADYPEIDWEHTHVVRRDGGLAAFCVYTAPDAGMIRDYSAAAGIPLDRIYEIHSDMVPHQHG